MSGTTLTGIMIAVMILFFAISSQTITTSTFLNLPGLAIVFGGTAAAVMFSYSLHDLTRVMHIFFIVMRKQKIRFELYVYQISDIALTARSKGLLMLQNDVHRLSDPFMKDGLNMLIDGFSTEEVRQIMEARILNLQLREQKESRVFRSMGKFAPAFGMIGTVIGLIAMLQKMSGSSIETLGPNMAVALVTTFYGLILANMVFNPIAEKLERTTEDRVKLMTLIVEGLVMIGEEWHPKKAREALEAFLAPAQRKSVQQKF